MERNSATTEETAIFTAIEEEIPWEKLSKRLKIFIGGQNEWNARIKDYCIRKRYRWSECHAKSACKEMEYYEDLIRYTRKSLALFPYHLADVICRILRVTPFRYYCDVLFEVLRSERSYDSIPNFAAADALRITGIGRNEFIDIMNKCRGKKLMWKLNKAIAKEYLPEQPRDFEVQPWWLVSVANLSLEEYRKLTPDEVALVDRVAKEHNNMAAEVDLELVRSLYKRGLVYFDVPVYSDDRFSISSLEGFVSNRDQSYEDPMEELLYNVFVASSERATVAELATTLQSNPKRLEAAVSVACRLGFAKKILDPSYLFGKGAIELTEDEAEGALDEEEADEGGEGLEGFGREAEARAAGEPGKAPVNRFALMVDANLTSYLMMGSLSPGLKRHAVTLFEAGKLNDGNVADIVDDLASVEGTRLEGELQRFADHAFSLRVVLQTLRSGGLTAPNGSAANSPQAPVSRTGAGLGDLLNLEAERRLSVGSAETSASERSGWARDVPFEERNGESGKEGDENDGATSKESGGAKAYGSDDEEWKEFQAADGQPAETIPPDAGGIPPASAAAGLSPLPEGEPNLLGSDPKPSPLQTNLLHRADSDSPLREDRTTDARPLTPGGAAGREMRGDALAVSPALGGDGGQDSQQSTPRAGTPRSPRLGSKLSKRLRYYVDVLRSESLASLQPSIVQQILKRDYAVIVSMVPLASSPVLAPPDGSGPVHFGPPSQAACTPWMKLLLYSVAQSGPPTLALVRGQRLRILPPQLKTAQRAAIWAWDGVGVGGVGGRGGEGTVVEGGLLLHALNTLLKFSAVLVQPIFSGGAVQTADVPLPLPEETVGDLLTSDVTSEPVAGDPFARLHREMALRRVVHNLHLGTLGYIRMVHFTPLATSASAAGGSTPPEEKWVPQSVEFGVPLFDTSLCKKVCEGAVRSRLFEPASLDRHRTAMLALRQQLREFMGDYRANGRLANEFFEPKSERSERSVTKDRTGSFSTTLSFGEWSSGTPLERRTSVKPVEDDVNELALPGVNLFFDGAQLQPVDLGACLQGRLPAALVADTTSFVQTELSRRVSLAA